ncbi:hypothetical protein NXS08_00065 [Gleimia sp. 6138-11-ORH1]|uniref:hypothetical protein n=1 Tax=Gleimia sp. 6138-11-ORH1 TaxID=2973937 RepID=UPI002166DEF0|nr:hypothetical protein [Gleimia sp. 6138-11-ORH1]MCS4483888.1 hypothetical protein [Gleimia sp. 6138-11-ORH1]
MFIIALLLSVGAGIAAWYLRQDTPAARAWESNNGIIDARFAFVFLPAFSMALLGLALLSIGGLSREIPWIYWSLSTFGGLLALVGLGGCVAGLFGKKIPLFLQPAWYRNRNRGARR